MRTLIRHILALVLLIGLTYLFWLRREIDHPLHRYNRAVADASYILLCLTLIIGPLVKFVSPLRFLLPWRREVGIAFTVSALLHVLIYARNFNWNVFRFFTRSTEAGGRELLENAFAISNFIGLIALLYAAVLFATSNDFAQRILGRGWKFLQQQSYTLIVLVAIHVAIFLFLVFPAEAVDPLIRMILVASGLVTLAFQSAGFLFTVWQRSRRRRRSTQA